MVFSLAFETAGRADRRGTAGEWGLGDHAITRRYAYELMSRIQ